MIWIILSLSVISLIISIVSILLVGDTESRIDVISERMTRLLDEGTRP